MARYNKGERCYALGYHPLFQMSRMLLHAFEKPMIIGSIAEMIGFFGARSLLKKPLLQPDVVRFLRKEQLGRLRFLLNFTKPKARSRMGLISNGSGFRSRGKTDL